MSSEMLLAEKYLRVVNDRGQRQLPLERVYRNLRQEALFLKAYANLYANQGALTAGSDPQDTVQGMSRERIRTILRQLEAGTYRFKPARRVYIPKANGQLRPLAVPSWTDKLVQEAMRMILEAYYEPRFKDESHGFRPTRGCHTALDAIQRQWKGVKWFIEGDIQGCFDNISHEKVLQLLERDIHDKRFLKLVRDLLKAGYMDDWQYHQTYSGTPQGGVISPLLANLVLHELDRFIVDTLIPQHTLGDKRAKNHEYTRVADRRYTARERGDWQRYSELGKQLYQMPSTDTHDPQFRRLKYIRYADDFLLGFIGTRAEAQIIKAETGAFLQELGLTLSEEKTHITHASTGRARFLGYDITVTRSDTKRTRYPNGQVRRTVNGSIALLVPRKVVQAYKGQYSRAGKPIHKAWMKRLSDYEIVATYGAQLRGIAQYYILATDVSRKLSIVYWYGMESLRKTLAGKHSLTTRQVYRRYHQAGTPGQERAHFRVTVEREGKSALIAKCGERPLKRRKPSYINDQQVDFTGRWDRRSELVTRLLGEECELCGKAGEVEVHHVRKVSDLKRRWQGRPQKPAWVEFMIARNRKTVIVCPQCHKDITQGHYDGQRIR